MEKEKIDKIFQKSRKQKQIAPNNQIYSTTKSPGKNARTELNLTN